MAKEEFGKKMDSYSNEDAIDFVGDSELTVEITLHEYRELIRGKAIADEKIRKATDDKYTREAKNAELERENASLKAEMYELKRRSDSQMLCLKEREEGDENGTVEG